MDHYHKKLNNNLALDWLKDHGITDQGIYETYQIGFADGSLLEITGDNQKKELIKLGILNDNYYEHFNNCITIPVYDENKQIVELHVIDITTNKFIKPIILNGVPALFNQRVIKVYDEVILTEDFIDALSLLQLDIKNVISVSRHDEFKAEYIKILQDNRVKTVIIAFKNEVASVFSCDIVKDLLLSEGFKIKSITLPHKDKLTKEYIEVLINTANLITPDQEYNLVVKKEGLNYIFAINDISYNLSGVKGMFISNLKVNIKAEYENEKFPDNLDLYSYRSRKQFSINAGSVFNIEAKRIEKDLLKILDYLETERDRKFVIDNDTVKQELTEEDLQIGLKFLKSPDLFQEIIDNMTTLGYVGEDLNKILLYLAASSRILDDPISVMIISQSASGKSMLVETLRKLLPPEEVVALTSLSDQALNYIGNLLHKFLIMGEAVHNELVEHQMRDMLSNHELSRLVPVKDEKTGKTKSEQIITKAIVSMVLGGTKYDINPENASRFFIVNADESIEQTNRIHDIQKDKYSIEREYIKEDVRPKIIKKHQCAQRLLKKITIVNPFRNHLKFPNTTMRTRRDFERFIDLIAVTCFLRQYQKEQKTDGRFTFIECDLFDYDIAYRIMINNVLPATMQDISAGALSIYEEVRSMAGRMAKKNGIKTTEVEFIQREARNFTGLNKDTVKKYFKILVDNEYIHLSSGKNRGTRFSYKLREDKPADKLDLSIIPTPAQMRKLQNM